MLVRVSARPAIADEVKSLEIRPETLSQALVEFGRQTGISIVFGQEAVATDYVSTNQLAPTPLFTGFERVPISIEADQPFNPFDKGVDDLRRRLVELGPRKQRNKSRNRRVVTGMSGEVAGFSWDFSGQYARTSASESFHGVSDSSLITDALRQDCVSPCVPLNLFGPAGSVTEQMLAYIDSPTHGSPTHGSPTHTARAPAACEPSHSISRAAYCRCRRGMLNWQPVLSIAKKN